MTNGIGHGDLAEALRAHSGFPLRQPARSRAWNHLMGGFTGAANGIETAVRHKHCRAPPRAAHRRPTRDSAGHRRGENSVPAPPVTSRIIDKNFREQP